MCLLLQAHGVVTVARLPVHGGHCDHSGNSRNRKNIAVNFCKLCGLIAIAVTICKSHCGRFSCLGEVLQLLLQLAADLSWPLLHVHGIVANVSAICGIIRGRILQLAEFITLTFLRGCRYFAIAVMGKRESLSALEHLHDRGGRYRVLRVILRVVLVEPRDLKTKDWGPKQRS